MTAPIARARRLGRPLLTLHRRAPLRVRLVGALLGLSAVALAVASVIVLSVLRSYLVDRVDSQLQLEMSRAGGYFAQSCLSGTVVPGGGSIRAGGPADTPYEFRVLTTSGRTVSCAVTSRSNSLSGAGSAPKVPALTPAEVTRLDGHAFTVGSVKGSGQWRVLAAAITNGSNDDVGTLVVAASLSDVNSTVSRLALTDVIVSLSVLLVLAGVGYLVVRTTLRPLVAVEETAEAIAAGDLSRRVPPRSHPATEVGRLAAALNSMLAQIERAFHAREASEQAALHSEERMRRFVADASHELRTPLTSIRGFAELYRQGGARTPGEVDRAMARIEAEAARMGLLVEDLLMLARLDRQRPLDLGPVDLLALAADAANDARAIEPGRHLRVVLLDGDGPAEVTGDEPRLRQVLGNLVSNALTHTPAGTPVEIRVGVHADAGVAVLEVSDSGPGLAPAQQTRVFERFYRADDSRSRSQGGSGLGLSIVAALVAAHGGTVGLESIPGEGATFRVTLPVGGPLAAVPEGLAVGDSAAGSEAVRGGPTTGLDDGGLTRHVSEPTPARSPTHRG